MALCGHIHLANQLRLQAAIELIKFEDYHRQQEMSMQWGGVTYREACVATTKVHTNSSAWAIQALASVIGITIEATYPRVNGNNDAVAKALDRTYEPRVYHSRRQKIHVMWSSLNEPTQNRLWSPNHFAPVVPVEQVVHINTSWQSAELSDEEKPTLPTRYSPFSNV